MARGWESKSVEAQQADHEADHRRPAALSPEEAARLDRRRTLEMLRARAVQDLRAARAPAHRKMLETALATLEAEIVSLGPTVK